jgi:hypothetical protein
VQAFRLRANLARSVIVPLSKELPEFVVSNNLRTAGISHKDYLVLLGERKSRRSS